MSSEEIKYILSQYHPVSLQEMDNVKLMDRTDFKFAFSFHDLPQILLEVKPFYRSLETNGVRISRYETLYYDTENFDLYSRHHSGKLNRYKIRSRKYVESELYFFEVKYKNNRGRTVKTRIRTNAIGSELDQPSIDLLKTKSNIVPETLKAVLWVNYSRITLVNVCSCERLTIDFNLHFIWQDKCIDMKNLVIAEVKQDKANYLSPIVNAFKQKHIHEGSISKYCLGVVHMFKDVKKNNFKEKIRKLNKLGDAA